MEDTQLLRMETMVCRSLLLHDTSTRERLENADRNRDISFDWRSARVVFVFTEIDELRVIALGLVYVLVKTLSVPLSLYVKSVPVFLYAPRILATVMYGLLEITSKEGEVS